MPGYGDPFAHLGVAALLLLRRRLPVMLVTVAVVLSDERAVLALPLAWLWQRDLGDGRSRH